MSNGIYRKFFDSEDDSDMDGNTFIPLTSDIDEGEFEVGLDPDAELPILPLRNIVLFPGVMLPISVGRKRSLRLVKEAYKADKFIGALTQRDKNDEEPSPDDLYEMGTVAKVAKVLEMPDGSTTVLLHGRQSFMVKEFVPGKAYLTVHAVTLPEDRKAPRTKDFKALLSAIRDSAQRIARMSGGMPNEFAFAIRNIDDPHYLINFVSANLIFPIEDKQQLLAIYELKSRAELLLDILARETQMLDIKASIQDKAMQSIDKQQREYFLQQQIKTIQSELGGSTQDRDIKDIRKQAEKKRWDDKTKEAVMGQIDKLESMSSHFPDYPMQANYVQTLVSLPWNEYTKDNFNLQRASKILNRNHYGLDDVKERILEHLAVLKLKGDMKAPIICLYGPPGVGKTSLGKSVADALGRKYVRVSLGGLHDEAEIRGHRRTYIGAMPGRIMQNLIKAKSSNPVFVLDEIDKVGSDYKGDPEAALLEVLDPEQNAAFHDNFVDMDFDLSKVMFIATANSLSDVSRALLDRMELINISGYILEEKVEIALRHLVPKQWEEHGLGKKTCLPTRKAIVKIIEQYTRESGVRSLDKQLAKLARKLARKLAMDEELPKSLSDKDVESYLGTPIFLVEKQEDEALVGEVTGLAWTRVGGETMQIECSLSKNRGARLIMTGNLGDVMKESAVLGLSYIKTHAEELGINPAVFDKTAIYIHVPEGATPKDGPSAGITMATSMMSSLTGRKVKKHLAMTGEITLKGRVLPVGGIKEKILAAKRAGVTDIILCRENSKDINDIKPAYVEGLSFHYVSNVQEVFNLALA